MLKRTFTTAVLAVAMLASAPLYAGNAGHAQGPAAQPAAPSTVAYTPPTAEESADMTFMREEEKLARDVYLRLAETWDLAPFVAIAGAEQRHMNALLRLLTRYQLPDPAAGKLIGEFTDPELQALHDALLAQGGQSPAAALKVGALIEEVDIEDNAAAMSRTTKSDVSATYDNLLCGSRNHLRAFARTLETLTGQAYVAQVLSAERVGEILATPMERCAMR